jgi:Arc/MetJ-type ribon-helix-helix transcriptional regulator
MTTLSADVTAQMVKWAEKKVKTGFYKSKSELVRELFREKMIEEDNDYLLSQKALEEIWKDEDDSYWESFL